MSALWRRQMPREAFYAELDALVERIKDDQAVRAARVYAEDDGTITVIDAWQQADARGTAVWKRRFYVVGCPHCIILNWDAMRYPEKESGRERYVHQIRSDGSRPSVQVAISPAAEAAELAEAAGVDQDDPSKKPLELGPPEGLSGRVIDSCSHHEPAEC